MRSRELASRQVIAHEGDNTQLKSFPLSFSLSLFSSRTHCHRSSFSIRYMSYFRCLDWFASAMFCSFRYVCVYARLSISIFDSNANVETIHRQSYIRSSWVWFCTLHTQFNCITFDGRSFVRSFGRLLARSLARDVQCTMYDVRCTVYMHALFAKVNRRESGETYKPLSLYRLS